MKDLEQRAKELRDEASKPHNCATNCTITDPQCHACEREAVMLEVADKLDPPKPKWKGRLIKLAPNRLEIHEEDFNCEHYSCKTLGELVPVGFTKLVKAAYWDAQSPREDSCLGKAIAMLPEEER